MTNGGHEHWMERERRETRDRSGQAGGRNGLRPWTGLGFLLCTGIAVGYGLWGLYGSGSPLVSLDVTAAIEDGRSAPSAPRLGPVRVVPAMNPLRAVLHATHAPVGSNRLHFEVEFEDAAGRRLWSKQGFLGSHDDHASVVRTTQSLATFDVPGGSDCFVLVRGSGSSMDDLREARLEIRRGVMRVDARIPWTFGLAATCFLIVNLLTGRIRPPHDPFAADDARRAA